MPILDDVLMAAGPDARELSALHEAFDLFRRSSGELAASYEALQGEVARLDRELASAYQRLESELKQREQLLNLLPGAVLVLDSCGGIEEANHQARTLFGDLGEERADWNTVRSACMEETEEPGEYRLRHGADVRLLVFTASNRPPPGGQILLFTDVTDTRERERERGRRERLAEMGRMAANMAHQLRTPLATAVLYLSQFDVDDADPAQRTEYVARALERLRRLEQLVRDALRHVRSTDEIGQGVSAGRLRDVLERCHAPLYRQKNVGLRFDWPDSVYIPGTLESWEAVLDNLLANALHFSKGATEVIAQLQKGAQSLRIRILDEGSGLALGLEKRLFEPFFTTRADGTGLGLSVARDYVEELGGRIGASNREEGGCVVEILVPLIGTKFATDNTVEPFSWDDDGSQQS
jgi:two-component system sensor histidine kinase FlrB